MSQRIEAKTLKGFRDYVPEVMIPRERLMDIARRIYRSYGFAPIDTPALEFLEVLTGKGGEETDKQMYRFQDSGGRWVGMRFDLTVPLARFAAMHIGSLGTPFKRYHIATVWRGENTQKGRYREFMQCDFDTLGTLSIAADIETALVIHDLLLAIGFTDFSIRVNNRQVLSGLLDNLELGDRSHSILRSLDKLGKADREKVKDEMIAVAGATPGQADAVLQLAEIHGTNDEVLSQLERFLQGNARGLEGAARLAELVAGTRAAGVPEQRLRLDLSIARGLDYYTGTVFETFLDKAVQIGSVCSGGRYDNLVGVFSDQQLPGIGASLGLDRLLAAMEDLGLIEKVATPADVFIPYFDPQRLHDYLRLAARLRAAGIATEVYPEPKKLPQQLKYADRRGFRLAAIMGTDELTQGTVQIKDLATRSSASVPLADVVAAVQERLGQKT
jgi:histidyl-tRNA synthetase